MEASVVPAENPDGSRGPDRPANTQPPPAWRGRPLATIHASPAWGTRHSPPPAPEGLSSAGKDSRTAGTLLNGWHRAARRAAPQAPGRPWALLAGQAGYKRVESFKKKESHVTQ